MVRVAVRSSALASPRPGSSRLNHGRPFLSQVRLRQSLLRNPKLRIHRSATPAGRTSRAANRSPVALGTPPHLPSAPIDPRTRTSRLHSRHPPPLSSVHPPNGLLPAHLSTARHGGAAYSTQPAGQSRTRVHRSPRTARPHPPSTFAWPVGLPTPPSIRPSVHPPRLSSPQSSTST